MIFCLKFGQVKSYPQKICSLIITLYIYINNNKGGKNLWISRIFLYISYSYLVDNPVDKLLIKCG